MRQSNSSDLAVGLLIKLEANKRSQNDPHKANNFYCRFQPNNQANDKIYWTLNNSDAVCLYRRKTLHKVSKIYHQLLIYNPYICGCNCWERKTIYVHIVSLYSYTWRTFAVENRSVDLESWESDLRQYFWFHTIKGGITDDLARKSYSCNEISLILPDELMMKIEVEFRWLAEMNACDWAGVCHLRKRVHALIMCEMSDCYRDPRLLKQWHFLRYRLCVDISKDFSKIYFVQ